MFNKQQIDKLLELKKKFGSGFIAVFYISILLSMCTFFIEYKYFLIVLFAPTIIVMLINPPFSEKRGVSFHCRPLFAFIGTGNIFVASSINSPDIKIRTVISTRFFRIGERLVFFGPRRKGEFTFNAFAAKISKIQQA